MTGPIPKQQGVGRAGLPDGSVEVMYADYLRLKSLRATGKLHGRTSQAMHELFWRRGLQTKRKLHQGIMHNGKKYTPGKGGLRRSQGRQKIHRGSMLHHVIWEENFGPIPAGHQVTFKNGDRNDFRPENLICLPRAEMSRRNSTGENGHTKAVAAKRIEENMGWIIREAQRYSAAFGVSMDDLIQEGRLAVQYASRKFNPKFGVKFLSYASSGIKQAMRRFAQDHSRIIRVPTAKFNEVPIHQVSTDAPIGDDPADTFGSVFLSEDESVTSSVDGKITAEMLQRVLSRLPKRTRKVIHDRFFENKTHEQIAEEIGVTRERVRQIEMATLRKLRRSRLLKEVA